MADRIIHAEVVGRDAKKLQSFFSELFGWQFDTNNPGGYGMYRQGNGITGGIGAAGNGQPPGVKFYVHTDNPQDTLAKVEASGGKILMPLTEVAPETNIALFADPEGHVVGIM